MVRISDILKQKGQFPEPDKEKKEQPAKEEPQEYMLEKIEKKAPEGIQISKAMAEGESEVEKEMQVARAMRQMQLNPEESLKVYNRLLEVIREILDKSQSQEAPLDLKEACEIVTDIVDHIVLGDKELIALTTTSTEDNYLYAHSANICIFSIDLGFGLGYNKSRLNELGLGAFLADIGMIKVMDIVKQPRILTEREYQEVKKHPIYSSDILSRIKDIQEGILYIAKQEHERLNGTGYPEGLKDDQIHEYAKIVAIVDVYEALIHLRPHRKAMDPHEAVKKLLNINSAGLFETSIIKLLINRIGLYPVGSWVELNTGEIAKVIASNEDLPLRPKVHILFGSNKKRLSKIKPLDLFHHSNLFIKRSVNPQELNLEL